MDSVYILKRIDFRKSSEPHLKICTVTASQRPAENGTWTPRTAARTTARKSDETKSVPGHRVNASTSGGKKSKKVRTRNVVFQRVQFTGVAKLCVLFRPNVIKIRFVGPRTRGGRARV